MSACTWSENEVGTFLVGGTLGSQNVGAQMNFLCGGGGTTPCDNGVQVCGVITAYASDCVPTTDNASLIPWNVIPDTGLCGSYYPNSNQTVWVGVYLDATPPGGATGWYHLKITLYNESTCAGTVVYTKTLVLYWNSTGGYRIVSACGVTP